jgi:hypothetical protein
MRKLQAIRRQDMQIGTFTMDPKLRHTAVMKIYDPLNANTNRVYRVWQSGLPLVLSKTMRAAGGRDKAINSYI